jgi:hypothetical protein
MRKVAPLLLGLVVSAAATPLESSTAHARPLFATGWLHNNSLLQGRSTIIARVYSPARTPLNDIYVELQNDTYSTIGRAKTEGGGRVTFGGLPDGTYKLRVLPYGTDYMEQTMDVTLTTISQFPGTGGGSEMVDIYLRVRRNANAGPFASPPGVIFAQAVPEAAKKLYEKGVRELGEKREKEGFDDLRKAIEIFPTYYAALERLGTEYVTRGSAPYYEAARVLLLRAVEVNPKGFPSTFGLGLAQYKLKMANDAVENLRRATTLHNQSVDAHLYLGLALSEGGKTAEAEAALKRANEVAKGKAAEVHFQLARLYSSQNRYTEAADALELYLKIKPDSPDADKMRQTIQQLRNKAAKK